jgi:hypothetical protein
MKRPRKDTVSTLSRTVTRNGSKFEIGIYADGKIART